MADLEKLEKMRHTAAHVLAQAVLKLYPDTKLGIGPAIDDGFYYDFEFSEPLSDEALPKIQKEMKIIMKQKLPLTQHFKTRKDAEKYYKDWDQEYKLDLLKSIPDKELSFYVTGDNEFADLCRGPHVEHTGQIGSFQLSKVAGAYWRGDENNKMLTRIYGHSFESRKELLAHLEMLEKAKANDHRKLGKELDLFTFSDVIGKGLPLWTHRGTTIRRELERFIVDEELKRGYLHVHTPDIANLKLYEKSGHYPYYKDSMYAPIKIDDEKFMLRPMTCPHHFELYLSKPRSYKELPMRIAELANLYRYEQTGELSGLMRVRTFCLADAHIVCADPAQAKSEVAGALELIEYVSKTLGIRMGEHYSYRLSLGDRGDSKKYYKDDESWDTAEETLREVLKERDCDFVEAPNEAAFYGPKIDVQMKNALGKEETAFTVQYDFVMPGRFNLNYINKEGEEQQAIVVHRSSIGAIERIVAYIIERYGGDFPLWLAPEQIRVVPISDKHIDYATEIYEDYKEAGLRVEIDSRPETLQYKIRDAELLKIPYLAIVGDKEIKTKTVSVRSRSNKQIGLLKLKEFKELLTTEIKNRGKIEQTEADTAKKSEAKKVSINKDAK